MAAAGDDPRALEDAVRILLDIASDAPVAEVRFATTALLDALAGRGQGRKDHFALSVLSAVER